MNHGTIHAEVDAMLKLPKQQNKTDITLCVFTTNKHGSILRMSMCCDHCIKSIKIIGNKKNYVVKKIYYINEDGELSTF
jgi:thiamine pyrophosphokinase